MAGLDKHILIDKLIELGWIVDPYDCLRLTPPDSLWKNKPKSLWVYDAKDLQDILGEEIDEEIQY